MHARRVFVPPDAHRGPELTLPPAEAHYLRHVLRMRPGEEVTAFDGEGWTARAALRSLGGKSGALAVIEERLIPKPSRGFSVALALLKTPAMDLAVRACTELGASAIAGFVAERSVPRASERSAGEAREERWRRIALEACRQCGHEFIPAVAALPGAASLAAPFRLHDAVYIACLREGCVPLGALLERAAPGASSRILLVIGPEGDFAPGELDSLIALGARPCRLSGPVLRAETAAAAGAALLAHHLLARTDAPQGAQPTGAQRSV